jgi:hypothetical protein
MQYKADCLKGLIGLSDGSITSDMEMYLDKVAGISLRNAGDQASSTYASGLEFLQDTINAACAELAAELPQMLLPSYRAVKSVRSALFGRIKESGTYTAADTDVVGIVFTDIWLDRLQVLQVNRIWLNQSSAAVTVTITDNITTQNVELVPGQWTTVNFTGQRAITVSYPKEIGETYALSPMRDRYCNCGVYTHFGIEGAGINDTDEAYGLSVDISANCDESLILCAIRPRMAFPLLYKTAQMTLERAAYSDRVNPIVTLGKEQALDLAAKYELMYEKYMQELRLNISSSIASIGSRCVQCIANTYRYGKP